MKNQITRALLEKPLEEIIKNAASVVKENISK